MVSVVSKFGSLTHVPESHRRENKTQEIDAYIAEGKIPVDVDLSQHPEKSVDARRCAFLISGTAMGRRIHSTHRAYGKGCRIHQRRQDRSGDVSRLISHHRCRFKPEETVWMNS